ncbi:hypothetical protein LOSG293_011340 [Secundilactobacillus oryzae JCM 18671]|uniref:Uncharacterized protein n=1 Tax=Secundilactobacillus oryzae JCM 18671 TaxID=1291743 RepID=A0A081BG66_9LACO|nr:hypothetical protein [Secundilactobacillus oryzae]GAK47034.1 hypothetical protein LOSG293_011340 [Secundilactobacillus oryzae JCM 18671]
MQKGTFASYREKARQTLAGHWGLAALLMLVTFLLVSFSGSVVYGILSAAIYFTRVGGARLFTNRRLSMLDGD